MRRDINRDYLPTLNLLVKELTVAPESGSTDSLESNSAQSCKSAVPNEAGQIVLSGKSGQEARQEGQSAREAAQIQSEEQQDNSLARPQSVSGNAADNEEVEVTEGLVTQRRAGQDQADSFGDSFTT